MSSSIQGCSTTRKTDLHARYKLLRVLAVDLAGLQVVHAVAEDGADDGFGGLRFGSKPWGPPREFLLHVPSEDHAGAAQKCVVLGTVLSINAKKNEIQYASRMP